jgi:hypothetical protein
MGITTPTSSMTDTFQPITLPFSAGYEMVDNADVFAWSEEEAAMDYQMYDALARQYGGFPVGYIDGLHYTFKRERTIPSGAVAVPERNHQDPETLLIQL